MSSKKHKTSKSTAKKVDKKHSCEISDLTEAGKTQKEASDSHNPNHFTKDLSTIADEGSENLSVENMNDINNLCYQTKGFPDNSHGTYFEMRMFIVCCMNIMKKNYKNFLLASGVEYADGFDDIVLIHNNSIFMVQVKHGQVNQQYRMDDNQFKGGKGSPLGLEQYFQAYINVKKNIKMEQISKLLTGEPINISMVICTNMLFEDNILEKYFEKIPMNDEHTSLLKLDNEYEYVYKFQQSIIDYFQNDPTKCSVNPKNKNKQTSDGLILNNNDVDKNKVNNIKHKQQSYVNLLKKIFADDNPEDVAKFFSHTIFALGFPDEQETLDNRLNNELNNLCNMNLPNRNENLIDKTLLVKFLGWMFNRFSRIRNTHSCTYLTSSELKEVFQCLTESTNINDNRFLTGITYALRTNIESYNYQIIENEIIAPNLLDFIVTDNQPYFWCSSSSDNNIRLTTVQIYNYLLNNSVKNIFVCCSSMISNNHIRDTLISVMNEQKSYLLIECNTNINYDFLEKQKISKIIFILQDKSASSTEILPPCYENFPDLKNKNISFQGREMKLNDFINNVSSSHRQKLFSLNILDSLLSSITSISTIGESIVKPNKFALDIYIKRRLKQKDEIDYISEDDFRLRSSLTIVSAEPGMGKTTFLNHKLHIIEPASNIKYLWKIRINVSSYKIIIDNVKKLESTKDVIAFLSLLEENEISKHFLEQYFNKLSDQHKLFVIIDGFDEVNHDDQIKLIDLVKCLIKNDMIVLITTRQNKLHILEEKFQSSSIFSFEDMLTEDQETYLINYWRLNHNSSTENEFNYQNACLDARAGKLIKLLNQNITKQERYLLGIPLICFMLAEAYPPLTNEEELSIRFDVFSLFQTFVNKKIEIYFNKQKLQQIDKVLQSIFHGYIIKIYQCLSFYYLFQNLTFNTGYKNLLNLFNDNFNFNEQMTEKSLLFSILTDNDVESINRIGIAEVINNEKIQFTHRTFAEYFVSTLFLSLLSSTNDYYYNICKEFLIYQIFKSSNEQINFFMNTRQRTNDIVNKRWNEIKEKQLIKYNSKFVFYMKFEEEKSRLQRQDCIKTIKDIRSTYYWIKDNTRSGNKKSRIINTYNIFRILQNKYSKSLEHLEYNHCQQDIRLIAQILKHETICDKIKCNCIKILDIIISQLFYLDKEKRHKILNLIDQLITKDLDIKSYSVINTWSKIYDEVDKKLTLSNCTDNIEEKYQWLFLYVFPNLFTNLTSSSLCSKQYTFKDMLNNKDGEKIFLSDVLVSKKKSFLEIGQTSEMQELLTVERQEQLQQYSHSPFKAVSKLKELHTTDNLLNTNQFNETSRNIGISLLNTYDSSDKNMFRMKDLATQAFFDKDEEHSNFINTYFQFQHLSINQFLQEFEKKLIQSINAFFEFHRDQLDFLTCFIADYFKDFVSIFHFLTPEVSIYLIELLKKVRSSKGILWPSSVTAAIIHPFASLYVNEKDHYLQLQHIDKNAFIYFTSYVFISTIKCQDCRMIYDGDFKTMIDFIEICLNGDDCRLLKNTILLFISFIHATGMILIENDLDKHTFIIYHPDDLFQQEIKINDSKTIKSIKDIRSIMEKQN
ncbi:unnamed protein product [Didymodactylos carnosus]|uniref:NACHT domain-containing protein n=1 Tax=Didymodactylos carnosus TaxID=1234261 RepID=A0A815FDL0_9BILA|nr:unnamed protein product [Didymodactylos carnosus]CAF1323691.1 unnamed protein product [Didymodactylos carnosus]CAF3870175.1 unnamed protein product [Didymodactylos carnosus]CAF4171687.1 unnamed protein product [Didymodactylos carnosus]